MPPVRFTPSSIRNKIKREDVHRHQKKKRGQEKLKRRLALAEAERKDPEAKKKRIAENVPKTLDNMREYDPTMLNGPSAASTSTAAVLDPVINSQEDTTKVPPVVASGPDEESSYDIATDPFAAYFSSAADPTIPPKVLITTSSKATKVTFDFCEELVGVFPGAEFVRRKKNKGFEIGKIAGWATGRGYSTLVVINEDRKKPNALMMVHLPVGPTAYFKLTSIALTKEIYGHARASPHHPELVLNGFVTRLGHAVGRMFQTVFPPLPEFEGRQVVTLHNQRDFLFFRRHRYMFKSTERAALQEIGPRFTLKLRYLKKGTPAVHNFGAAPLALTFDDDADDDENNENDAAAVMNGEGQGIIADESTTAHEEGDDPLPPTPVLSGPTPKDEEYIWQWKPELETSRKTFFL